jgi:hypothetical protein
MLRPAGTRLPKTTEKAKAATEARLAAIFAALPIERPDKDE